MPIISSWNCRIILQRMWVWANEQIN